MIDKIDVLVADDQHRARQSLRALLSTWPPAGVVLEADSGREALRVVEESRPGLVLMDARMPEMDGLQATLQLKIKWPQIKVVVLSMYGEYEAEALAVGADAFVGKGEPPDRLLRVLSAVISGLNGPSPSGAAMETIE
ncbi:MAG: DNA-binding response regulator [Chloroflexi bacterium]|nr:MAG: DNA-binding response regulator [Chloroflexota bacterium]